MAAVCAIGLMSGTSMDGIDLAILRSDGGRHVERGPSGFVPYEAAFRRRIEASLETAKSVSVRTDRPGDLASLEDAITLRHAEAVKSFVSGIDDPAWRPSLVGFHGQTVLHRPDTSLTVQLGDGARLAEALGLPVVWDMRAADMVAGGQGAPLVPAYHVALAASLPLPHRAVWPKAFVNVGGISNVTWVPEHGDPVAFDSGPGNALIDQWVAREGGIPFDQDGRIASEGGIVASVTERYLASPFFARRGPKSLDRADFTLAAVDGLELADGARTLAHVSAAAILRAADAMPEPPRLWVLCGGGRRNPHIVADMRAGSGDAQVLLAEEVDLDGDAMEAEAWAYLAIRSVRQMPLTFPTTTGCRQPTNGGIRSDSPNLGKTEAQA